MLIIILKGDTISHNNSDRVFFFDILRIIAIALVITAHMSAFANIPYLKSFYGVPHFYWVSLGGLGVTIFLIVSGSSLALRYPSFCEIKDVIRFYIRRVTRIFPTYWMAILFTVLLFLAVIPGYSTILNRTVLLLTFSGMYSLTGQWGGPVLNASWYIGLIMVLYAIYPVLLRGFNKNPHGMILLLLVISLATRLACGYLESVNAGHRITDWVPSCRLFEFGLGIWLVKTGNYLKDLSFSDRANRAINFAGAISFPLFLLNSTFLESTGLYKALHFNTLFPYPVAAYCWFSLAAMLTVSVLIWYIDLQIQRRIKTVAAMFLVQHQK